MGSAGGCYDNAMCESFFATFECELLDRRKFKTKAEARVACFEFIEGWYNSSRGRSASGYKSPINYERIAAEALEAQGPQPSTKPQEIRLQALRQAGSGCSNCAWRRLPKSPHETPGLSVEK